MVAAADRSAETMEGGLKRLATADREMEQRAMRAKELLHSRYSMLSRKQERRAARRLQLEKKMATVAGLDENEKRVFRSELAREEVLAERESRRKVTTSDFEVLAVIGRGAFGEVTLVRRRPGASSSSSPASYGKVYALKSMKKQVMLRKNQVHHIKAEREALSLADENYPWLTHLHYSFQDESNLYMVLEFMPGGDLMTLLIQENVFPEHATKFLIAEAAHAVSAIHALGYIHRDLKPDNILISADGHLKLTDLGLCKKIGDISPKSSPDAVLEAFKQCSINGEPSSPKSIVSFEDNGLRNIYPVRAQRRELAKTCVGTPDYIAPEVLKAQTTNEVYDASADWWSLGCIMFECLAGFPPFYAKDEVETCRKILRWRETLSIPTGTRNLLSASCVDFLARLITDTHSRIGSTFNSHPKYGTNGFAQIVNHPWFDGFDWKNLGKGDGPILPRASKEFSPLLKELEKCPKNACSPRYQRIIERLTVNFDAFDTDNNGWYANPSSCGNKSSHKSPKVGIPSLDPFYDYHFTRHHPPQMPDITSISSTS